MGADRAGKAVRITRERELVRTPAFGIGLDKRCPIAVPTNETRREFRGILRRCGGARGTGDELPELRYILLELSEHEKCAVPPELSEAVATGAMGRKE